MKTIGMLGGMSWESTSSYYRAINEGVKQQLGGLHSAKIVMNSVDFEEIEKLQREDDWPAAAKILVNAAQSIAAGGADFLIICTNTMHIVSPEIEAAIDFPLLHIADATAQKLLEDGVSKVGLLGTAFTMEKPFYKNRLIDKHGIDVIVPDTEQRNLVHKIIYDELCLGTINDDSRIAYLEIIQQLKSQGAEAVILGCTEIALLVNQQQTDVSLYDTTSIHASQAVNFALND